MNRADAPRNTCCYDYENRTDTTVAFDELVDAKGRTLGAHIRIVPVSVTAGHEPGDILSRAGFSTPLPVGTHFSVCVHVTRAGTPFGATPRDRILPSLAAAQRKADELVAAARARYAKRAAAGQKL